MTENKTVKYNNNNNDIVILAIRVRRAVCSCTEVARRSQSRRSCNHCLNSFELSEFNLKYYVSVKFCHGGNILAWHAVAGYGFKVVCVCVCVYTVSKKTVVPNFGDNFVKS